ncbi:MAG: DUF6314 family protein [Solirubrobacteraceae bacterium]
MPTIDVDDTLDFLVGTWSLSRELADHRTGARGSFTGTAVLRPVRAPAPGAEYEEVGRIRLGGHEGPAQRQLRWLRAEGAVQVLFADGRPFFELDLRDGSCRVEHQCRADLYELSFQLADPDRLQERWRVRGPSKDYDAFTTWTRRRGPVDGRTRIGVGRHAAMFGRQWS